MRPEPATPSPPAGETVGVEEEYHVVDPVSFELARRPALADRAAAGELGPLVHGEIQSCQLEIATEVCRTLDDVRRALVTARRAAADAAAGAGAAILAAGTHPFASWRDLEMVTLPHYAALVHRFGALAVRQDICGCHVHVGIPDLELAVAVMNHARPYLPLLAALTSSSPFHDGADTGFASFRTMWWSTWPTSGPPPQFDSVAHYERVVGELVSSGVMHDATTLYWDLRPSTRYPTLEFRVADVCPDLDDALLHAVLVRSLTRTLVDRVQRGVPPRAVSDAALVAARWRARPIRVARRALRPGDRGPGPGGARRPPARQRARARPARPRRVRRGERAGSRVARPRQLG